MNINLSSKSTSKKRDQVMKKIVNLFLMILVCAVQAFAQKGPGIGRIHAAKMAYIADRLELKQNQYSTFMPLYKQYETEIWETRSAFFKKNKGGEPGEGDKEGAMKWVDDDLDYQQKIIDIKRKYNDQFLKVITPRQLADMYVAEREFRQILKRRLEDGGGGGRFRGERE